MGVWWWGFFSFLYEISFCQNFHSPSLERDSLLLSFLSLSLSLFLLYISHLFVFTMVISHMERTIIFFRSLSLVSAFSPLCVNVYSPCLPFFFKKIYPSLISRQCQCQSLNQASLAGSDFAVSLLSWVSWLFFSRGRARKWKRWWMLFSIGW